MAEGPAVALLALAAAGAGESRLSAAAWQRLRAGKELQPLVRLSLDARYLGVCEADCHVTTPPAHLFQAAPAPIQARLLNGLARHDAAAARHLALLVMERTDVLDLAKPAHEKASLLAAAAQALERAQDPSGARRLAQLAWEWLPVEPALGFLLKPISDEEMLLLGGHEGGVRHLEALLEARQNYEVIHFGNRLCGKAAVTQKGALCPALPPVLQCRAAFATGKGLRQARKTVEAERVLQAVALKCPPFAERARFLQAKAAMAIRGAGARAAVTLERLAVEHPQSTLVDDAWILAGEAAWRDGDRASAERYWMRVVQHHAEGDMWARAVWSLALAGVLQERPATALQWLGQLEERLRHHPSADLRRAQYWRARLATAAETRLRLMEALILSGPPSYEAMLARGRLREEKTDVPLPRPLPAAETPSPPAVTDPATAAGLALEQWALDEDAAAFFRQALRLPGAAGVFAARHLISVNDAPSASRHVRDTHGLDLLAAPSAASMELWQLAYPLAHEEAILATASETGVPKALLFALAREESAFDARAMSLSGAVGLMQLMPATALTEAMALKIRVDSEDALKEPVLNARLGGTYLAKLLRQFHGHPVPALAAYNAGPSAVRKWLRADPEGPVDLFLERMPIGETRDYVRRVMDSYAVYTMLYDPGAAPELPPRLSSQPSGF
jgi:soluble lytic murein transglycosylase